MRVHRKVNTSNYFYKGLQMQTMLSKTDLKRNFERGKRTLELRVSVGYRVAPPINKMLTVIFVSKTNRHLHITLSVRKYIGLINNFRSISSSCFLETTWPLLCPSVKTSLSTYRSSEHLSIGEQQALKSSVVLVHCLLCTVRPVMQAIMGDLHTHSRHGDDILI